MRACANDGSCQRTLSDADSSAAIVLRGQACDKVRDFSVAITICRDRHWRRSRYRWRSVVNNGDRLRRLCRVTGSIRRDVSNGRRADREPARSRMVGAAWRAHVARGRAVGHAVAAGSWVEADFA